MPGRSPSRARWTTRRTRFDGSAAPRSSPRSIAASEGPRIVRRAGIEAIRAKSVRQTARLIELADARGYGVRAPRDATHRGGTVAVDVPHGYEVSQFLLSRNVLVDYRPNAGIRIAPHFYTSDSELDQAIDMIDEALSSDAWRAFERHEPAVVT